MRKRINANREIEEQNRIKTGQERLFIKQLARVFDTIDRVAKAEYKKNGSVRRTIASIEGRVEKLLKQHYRRTIITFAGRSEKGETKRQSRFQHIADDYVARQGGEKITQISQTTKNRINKVVARGIADGDGADAIARNIGKATGGAIGRKRAATIAKTEVNAAANFANDAIDRENRVEGLGDRFKRWVSTGDGRTRRHHAVMNGKQVLVDDAFKVRYNGNTYSMQRPGDSAGGAGNVINCRCTLIYVDGDIEITQNGVVNMGDEEVNFWAKGASAEEIDWLQRTLGQVKDPEIIAMIRNGGVVRKFNYNGTNKSFFLARDQSITLKARPGVATGRDALRQDLTFVHEKMHAIDFLETAPGVFEVHSSANTTAMLRDFKALFSYPRLRAVRQAVIDEIDTLESRVFRDGLRVVREIAPPANNAATLANLKDTGFTITDLVRLMPELRKAEKGIRRSVLREASIHLKHRNWDGLDSLMHGYSNGNGAIGKASDYIQAISRARVGYGHSQAYYKRGRALDKTGYKIPHVVEAFAEYGTLRTANEGKTWLKLLSYYAPESTKGFAKLVKKLAEGPRTTVVKASELGE